MPGQLLDFFGLLDDVERAVGLVLFDLSEVRRSESGGITWEVVPLKRRLRIGAKRMALIHAINDLATYDSPSFRKHSRFIWSEVKRSAAARNLPSAARVRKLRFRSVA